MNFQKSCGNDFLYPKVLKIPEVRQKVVDTLYTILNQTWVKLPEYWKETRLVLLAKENKDFALVSNTRPISVQQTIVRVLEKFLLAKMN